MTRSVTRLLVALKRAGLLCPASNRLSDVCLSDVCLSVCLSVAYIGPKTRTERSRKNKISTELAHSCSGGRGNVLAVGNSCYVDVCSAAQGASATMGEKSGRGISWRPPAYSLF